ncbi:MAG TPA: hypothetical protein VNR38_08145 [Ureibacillus sp.]|nr:hypothetical protein [Ureibacillus sp.]
MDEFNRKQDFQELRKLTRSAFQKNATFERIRNGTMKSRNPFNYIFSSVMAILLAVLIFVPSLFSLVEQNKHSNDVKEDLEHFKSNIEIGLTMDEVKEILGEHYTESYFQDIQVWKYEIGKTEEYQFNDGFLSYIDFEEMKKGKIGIVMFVFWDENNLVKQYSTLYLNEKDTKIYDFKVLSNGTVFEEPIYPTKNTNETQNVNVDIGLFKSKMKIGITMEQVEAILGESYSIKIPSDTGIPSWIYELEKSKGYQFINEFGLADLEGMKQGKIKAHLSVVWDENNLVKEYSALYLNEHDNRIYEFRVFPNGQSKDNPIF